MWDILYKSILTPIWWYSTYFMCCLMMCWLVHSLFLFYFAVVAAAVGVPWSTKWEWILVERLQPVYRNRECLSHRKYCKSCIPQALLLFHHRVQHFWWLHNYDSQCTPCYTAILKLELYVCMYVCMCGPDFTGACVRVFSIAALALSHMRPPTLPAYTVAW